MGKIRNILTCTLLPLLFLWYIGGISLFPHTHIIDGVAVVHSHPFPDADHRDGDDILTIRMLCQFVSCGAGEGVHLPQISVLQLPGTQIGRVQSAPLQNFYRLFSLRAPPAGC